MSLEFDPQCASAQPEDSLQLYVPTVSDSTQKSTVITPNNKTTHSEEPEPPALPYWPVLHKFSGW